MKVSKEIVIVICFALIHAATSFLCRHFGIGDDLLLTLLTMIMAFFLCLNSRVSSKFMVITLISVNIIGMGMGIGIARLFMLLSMPAALSHPLATFICTGILGCGVHFISKAWAARHDNAADEVYSSSLNWFMAAFVAVILLRLLVIALFAEHLDSRSLITGILVDYVFSCLAIVAIAIVLMKQIHLANYRYETLSKQVETKQNEGFMEHTTIKCGNRIIPVQIDDAAYFFSENKCNHIVLFSGTTYIIESTISDLEIKLNPQNFFRVSRGCIVSKKCIESVSNIESGRAAIESNPKSEIPITVSRARVEDFMRWLKA